MLFDVVDLIALLWVDLHDVLHHVLRLLVHVAGYQVLAREDLFVKLVRIRVFKRQVADCHCVQDHAEGPQVSVESTVALSSDHLR